MAMGINIILLPRNLIKLSIKYQSYTKSKKIYAFEQKLCVCHNLSYNKKKNQLGLPAQN